MSEIAPRTPLERWAELITAAWRQSVNGLIQTGQLLLQAKANLPHGEFTAMAESQLPFKRRKAQMLMAIAECPRLLDAQHVALLPPHITTMYDLSQLEPEQFQACVADGTINPEMERSDAHALVAKRNAESRRQLAQDLSDCAALQSSGRKFSVVYADPAYRRKAGIGNRAYENHYVTSQWAQILAMPVEERLLPDAWLFLWIPRAHLLALHPTEIETPLGRTVVELPLAWAIAQAWGFDAYSTCFIWTKTDEEFPEDHGLGLIAWDQDEVLCLFKRGRGLPKPDTDIKFGSNHRERAGKHSAKPNYYRDMINAMTGNLPVLELFAREDDENPLPSNFFTWGNQSTNSAESENISADFVHPRSSMSEPALASAATGAGAGSQLFSEAEV